MGLTALYAAFAAVALWLAGELLLQRRAPLHWRALALAGFLILVGGVFEGSLPLIGAGVAGFGLGQYLASRAVKAGGGPYWVLLPAERVPVVGRLFAGAAAASAQRSEPVRVGTVGPAEPVDPAESGGLRAAAGDVLGSADPGGELPGTGEESVYYGYEEQEQQQAAYYAYAADQQVPYAEYAQYAEYTDYPAPSAEAGYPPGGERVPQQAQYGEQRPQQYDAYGQPVPSYAADGSYGAYPAYTPYEQQGQEYAPYPQYAEPPQYTESQQYAESQQYPEYPAQAPYPDYSQGYPAEYGYPQQQAYPYPYPEEHLQQG